MIRYFEVEDKAEISRLACDFYGNSFDEKAFGEMFDDIIRGVRHFEGISVLHAGEYLGFCICGIEEKEVTVKRMYIKPAFQKLKVSAQIFDFIEENHPGCIYKALCPADNETAVKLFTKRGYTVVFNQ